MLYNFAIFLHSRWETNQWQIYHGPRNRTLIDYRAREKEKERQLISTNRKAYNRAYNRIAYNRAYNRRTQHRANNCRAYNRAYIRTAYNRAYNQIINSTYRSQN